MYIVDWTSGNPQFGQTITKVGFQTACIFNLISGLHVFVNRFLYIYLYVFLLTIGVYMCFVWVYMLLYVLHTFFYVCYRLLYDFISAYILLYWFYVFVQVFISFV